MTDHNDNYHTLPGNCVVKPVTYSNQHITLSPRLLSPFGFDGSQPAMVLMTPGCLVITTDPQQQGEDRPETGNTWTCFRSERRANGRPGWKPPPWMA